MKLTDTQLIILSKAAQREDHAVATIDKRYATRDAVGTLLKAKLLKPASKISGTAAGPVLTAKSPLAWC